MPIQFYDALSSFFVDIEKGNRNAPLRMSQVKQVLLPKPGSKPGDPLSKRIIALLSVFIVSYTSLRFKQLCYWQNAIFPPELCGGIKGRVLSTIPVHMRLDIDHASSAGKTLLGVKIDKSKAFDRIVPAVAALLMLAFGVERSLVNFFTQLYPRLERYTCIGPWCSSLPLRTTNGLVQGCSLSLLSMNLQMSVRVLVLKRLEALSIRSFVDDAYIWCDLIHRDQLQEALRLTSVWDEMTGMATNTKKCQSWSNTTGGRKLVQSLFPKWILFTLLMSLVLNCTLLKGCLMTGTLLRPRKSSKMPLLSTVCHASARFVNISLPLRSSLNFTSFHKFHQFRLKLCRIFRAPLPRPFGEIDPNGGANISCLAFLPSPTGVIHLWHVHIEPFWTQPFS